MKQNEELLQRCFDNDLDDEEMQRLFSELSENESLRIQFRSFQSLREELQMIPSQNVPSSLDERIGTLRSSFTIKKIHQSSLVRQFVSRKISFSLPAIAASILLMLFGSYFVVVKMVEPKPQREYVYIMELPQIEVHAVLN